MDDPDKVTGHRARRSTRVSSRLARARERNNRQLVRIRERELRVDRALADYVAAADLVTVAERACAVKVAELEQKIRQVRDDRDRRLADVRAAQARAALTIHDAGRTVFQVAELLELSEKVTRQLIKAARTSASGGGSGATATGGAGAPRSSGAQP